MIGATDVQLRVTMDASQARAEAARLHSEMNRRFRAATPDDASRVAWERSVGMPVNPVNPNLPYEQVRHSGIWWANQRGIKGLAGEQYRHQFFNEREARYMGLQFAKAARKELIAGAKSFAVTMGLYALDQGMSTYYAWAKVPGQNNREINRQEATYGGIRSGAMTGGSILGTIAMFTPWGLKAKLAMWGLGALTGGAIGGFSGNSQARAQERNEDINWQNEDENQRRHLLWRRRLTDSQLAFSRQMELMPSRRDRLAAIERQMNQIHHGKGSMSITHLEGLQKAMLEGGVYNGRRYKPGDLEKTEGKNVLALLSQQRDRYFQLETQKHELQMTPWARPQEAITDSFSRRGLYVGAQVDTLAFNREIINNMKKIVDALEKMRTFTPENYISTDLDTGKRVRNRYK